jgi:hypothetical protein
MFVSAAAFKIACELSIVGLAGLVAMLSFVVLTVDRLNARLAELEAQIGGRVGIQATASGSRRGREAPSGLITRHPDTGRSVPPAAGRQWPSNN